MPPRAERGTPRADDGLYRHAHETHHVKLFRESDVRGWLAEAGFRSESAGRYGDVPLAPRRVAYVAERVRRPC